MNGRPPTKSRDRRTTLLVASPALLDQWEKEIQLHTDCGLHIQKHTSGLHVSTNNPEQWPFGVVDILLTTYQEVMRSYPRTNPPIACQTAEEKISWWKKEWEEKRGILHRVHFLRIVLDEAQAIKNHMSRTSIACRALMGEHRWALSGTPILNNLEELYPYFKFLNVPWTGSFRVFKNNYCNSSDETVTNRLLVRLGQFMIRRTHGDQMFGTPILKLPRADQQTHWCTFNPIERRIYDIVEKRFAMRINSLRYGS